MLLSLYYLFCFSSDLNLQKKQIMNDFLLKTSTVNQCSITFVQFTSFVYGTFLIQYLNARMSLTLAFFTLNYSITLSISLFVDANQLTVAKMDNFLLLQIIERIPELRFKYMGSYLSDEVPQLTKYSFAIVNSAPRNDRGEHWIMIARLDKTYYSANSLGRKRAFFSFVCVVFICRCKLWQ